MPFMSSSKKSSPAPEAQPVVKTAPLVVPLVTQAVKPKNEGNIFTSTTLRARGGPQAIGGLLRNQATTARKMLLGE